jgi:hypothetical protein
MRCLCLIFGLVFSIAMSGFGQSSDQLVLIDQFGELPCNDRMARLDHFFIQLANHPDSQGLVEIGHSPGNRMEAVFQQRMIERYTRFRGFDLDRIDIERSSSSKDLTVSFWRIPAGAPKPEYALDTSFEITEKTTPFLFASEEVYGQVECSKFDIEIFGKFLKANPAARANLVFRDRSARNGRHRADEILSVLIGKHGIEKHRIRTFFVKPRPGSYEPITEFWYLP